MRNLYKKIKLLYSFIVLINLFTQAIYISASQAGGAAASRPQTKSTKNDPRLTSAFTAAKRITAAATTHDDNDSRSYRSSRPATAATNTSNDNDDDSISYQPQGPAAKAKATIKIPELVRTAGRPIPISILTRLPENQRIIVNDQEMTNKEFKRRYQTRSETIAKIEPQTIPIERLAKNTARAMVQHDISNSDTIKILSWNVLGFRTKNTETINYSSFAMPPVDYTNMNSSATLEVGSARFLGDGSTTDTTYPTFIPNNIMYTVPAIVNLIDADIVCLQEVPFDLHNQINQILYKNDYLLAIASDKGGAGNGVAIYFKRNKFESVAQNFVAHLPQNDIGDLSEQISHEGSNPDKYIQTYSNNVWNPIVPRDIRAGCLVGAYLRNIETDTMLLVCSVHIAITDYKHPESFFNQMKIVQDIAEAQIVPIIITGDLNPPITPSSQQAKAAKQAKPEILFKAELIQRLYKTSPSPKKSPKATKETKEAKKSLNSSLEDSTNQKSLRTEVSSPFNNSTNILNSPTAAAPTSSADQSPTFAAAATSSSPVDTIKRKLFPSTTHIFNNFNIIKSPDKDYDYMLYKDVTYKKTISAETIPYSADKAARNTDDKEFLIDKNNYPSDHLPFIATFELTHEQVKEGFKQKISFYLHSINKDFLNTNQEWLRIADMLKHYKELLFTQPFTRTLQKLYTDVINDVPKVFYDNNRSDNHWDTTESATPVARALTFGNNSPINVTK